MNILVGTFVKTPLAFSIMTVVAMLGQNIANYLSIKAVNLNINY